MEMKKFARTNPGDEPDADIQLQGNNIREQVEKLEFGSKHAKEKSIEDRITAYRDELEQNFNLDEYLRRKEFPVTCESDGDEMMEIRAILMEFQKELKEIKKELKLQKTTSTGQNRDEIGIKTNHETQLHNRKKCPSLPTNIPYGKITCSDSNHQGSICNITCLQNHIIKGENTLYCENDFNWSHNLPTCVCNECEVGEYCEQGTSWHVLQQMIRNKPLISLVYYAGYQIKCSTVFNLFIGSTTECIDSKTSHAVKCTHGARLTAIEGAVAELIRQMVQKKFYPMPCDIAKMPKGC
uniref:uncharacterized protein LOC120343289 n=1 Tax=Styela clava TaxID=7725 RepID=UPI001939DF1B|nr:uncharacterized protein LOC120343289 [Styela clava]